MIKWTKISRNVNAEGEVTITYRGEGTPLLLQSRKRNIPHANRSGCWQATTYVVMRDGEDLKECYTKRDAEVWAEQYAERRGLINGQPV